ncbi:MAG: chorismate synthase, partial [Clostridia bacterium]|nr:chorismate synthase [Clostridia bacterium]
MFNDEEFSVYNGEKLTVKVYGASHSEKIGVVADGLNGGFKTDLHSLNKFLSRRKPTSSLSTSRTEEDEPVFLSGIDGNGVLTGERFEAVIYNRDVKSEDYSEKKIPRPSHADFVGWSKYGDGFDNRGGGKFSGRLTAPICVLGGIIKQILAERGIKINAFISAIGKINGKSYKTDDLTDESFESENGILLSDDKKEEMLAEVENAKAEGDSVGGKIDCVITGVPVGTGEYMFSAAEGKISRLAFAAPAVKGIEFGDGFDLVKMKGSTANDQFAVENGKI